MTKEKRAIKIIKGEQLTAGGDLMSVFQEVKALGALSHPNIVKHYSSFAYHGQIVILLEYIAGGSLRSRLESSQSPGRLSEEEARQIVCQLVDVLGYCHSRGYVHGDLKLDNILLADSRAEGEENKAEDWSKAQVKLIDFGLARKQNEISCAGTLSYSPPEIVSGSCLETHTAIDIWALGVIMHRIVLGYFPFLGQTKAELKNAILTQELPHVHPQVSLHFWDLTKGMLAKERTERLTLQGILGHSWLNQGNSKCSTPALPVIVLEAKREKDEEETKAQTAAGRSCVDTIEHEHDADKKEHLNEIEQTLAKLKMRERLFHRYMRNRKRRELTHSPIKKHIRTETDTPQRIRAQGTSAEQDELGVGQTGQNSGSFHRENQTSKLQLSQSRVALLRKAMIADLGALYKRMYQPSLQKRWEKPIVEDKTKVRLNCSFPIVLPQLGSSNPPCALPPLRISLSPMKGHFSLLNTPHKLPPRNRFDKFAIILLRPSQVLC